ncbi:MAG: L,D-transpeptidase family protein [Solirubrobacteraceae bacterium]|nr:MAG: hypothetical protein DLM63_07005 [Solirubrobacterales bacterium]
MRSRSFIAVTGVLVVLVAAIVAMVVYDSSRSTTIAKGIQVAHVDVGGLSRSQARARLQSELLVPLNQPIVVRAGGHRYTLSPQQAHIVTDVNGDVQEAINRSHQGSIFSRTFRNLTGARINADLPARVEYDHTAVANLVRQVAMRIDRAPTDAQISYSSAGISTVPEAPGRALFADPLRRQLRRALTDPRAARVVDARYRTLPAHVTQAQLSAKYPSIIVVNRSAFELKLFKHLKLAHTYPIAVGMQGLDTPAGLWHIQWEQTDPPWYVPNDAWAGSLAGKTIPPGPQDPLKARFMSFNGGAGIHGIDPSEYGTIGHTASHGCIRMTIPDVINLYDQVKVGDPVYIA